MIVRCGNCRRAPLTTTKNSFGIALMRRKAKKRPVFKRKQGAFWTVRKQEASLAASSKSGGCLGTHRLVQPFEQVQQHLLFLIVHQAQQLSLGHLFAPQGFFYPPASA